MYDTADTYHDTAYRITHTLDAAYAHRNQIAEHLADLKQQEFYQAVPRLVWETRDGTDNEYAYLIFPQGRYTSGYTGPNGKRKVYVGKDPLNVAQAEAAIRRTQQIAELETDLRMIDSLIQRALDALQTAKSHASYIRQVLHLDQSDPIPHL